ncbi:protein WHAT'S THIS FACTOR 1, chloroplastic [Malania oleifera]|uniref:protein WHAT'S THIS FACTOR 1, chloroplastic n=1 Tax=Malania oleifera TaxID=397392 RepID=UPI0025AEBD46|nr:protein WHAT'S THIS FACTOR 1, chloroplastic [Malania oleifera]XP_057957289.1 protein WHAT'S THIS FACTOR 1, chloroplastic [Malania oleifera]XP_057957290.1 protein WHAT'S THIS FACTOR 1, chloroplastic [Malania oleifera]
MALSLPMSMQRDKSFISFNHNVLSSVPLWMPKTIHRKGNNKKILTMSISCLSIKIVRSPSLDKHAEKQNRIRFVQKLKTLLLSKPKHYMPLHILSKCRSYLSLSKSHSLLSMIRRYPAIFELFSLPLPPTPFNAATSCSQLCVRLTPAAAALAAQESKLKLDISITLATKLQKLLMLSSHRRLLLSKLVHLAPDLGLPPNFRSRLCNDHTDKFKTVNTSYGRALELVSWNPDLANPFPSRSVESLGFIMDRPLKFKHLRLRKGLNLKRRHRDFLIRFEELPNVCPYNTAPGELAKESIESEKRSCSVVREVLGMMGEKRTLVDHLTHFRKDFGLPNKLWAMLVRHPELFYVSPKGQRDSVFLVEAFDDKGVLLEKDESLVYKDRLLELIREGKRMRREWRKGNVKGACVDKDNDVHDNEVSDEDVSGDYEYIDGFEDLFECEDVIVEHDNDDDEDTNEEGKFWTADASFFLDGKVGGHLRSW